MILPDSCYFEKWNFETQIKLLADNKEKAVMTKIITAFLIPADSGTWTHTKSPSQDFESCASAIPPYPHTSYSKQQNYDNVFWNECQENSL